MIKNLTPHDVWVVDDKGTLIWFYEESDKPARCKVTRKEIGRIGKIPLYKNELGQVYDLPARKKGVYLIVSRVVAEVAKRGDLLVPDNIVRNSMGEIEACKGFSKV